MKIYWKNQVAYDENDNFLAIIHQSSNDYFCVLLNYPTEDIDYRQLDVNEPTLELAMEKTKAIFKEIKDISEVENLLNIPCDNSELPNQFLTLLSKFTTHCP
jgi:hypothetical protein